MSKLWLHIGSHKTGTTSTQKSFALSRRALLKAGLVYPWNKLWFENDPGRVPRGYASHYVTEEAMRLKLDRSIDAMHEGFKGDEWILSSELMSTMRENALAHMLEVLGARFDDIRALMYVREPGDLAISRTSQHIVMGNTTYEAACAEPKVYQFRQNMSPWLKLLGKERFAVRVYDKERLTNGNVVDDVLAFTGRDAQKIKLKRSTRAVTPSHGAILAMSERNARGDGDQRRQGYRNIPGPRFTLPPEVIEEVRARSAEDVAWMKEEFGVVFDPKPAAPVPQIEPAESET